MKYLYLILMVCLTQSCFHSPVDPPEEPDILQQIWNYPYELASSPEAPPIIWEGKVYVSGDLYLTALNEKDGTIVWKTQIDDKYSLRGQKLLLRGNQIVVNHLEKIRGWNTASGNQEWEYVYSDTLEPRRNGNHSVTEKGYVFSTYNSKIFELNMNGERILEKSLDSKYIVHGVSYFEDRFYTGQTQTVHGGLTLGRITALNAQTGDSLWVYETEEGGFTYVAPIVEDGVIYAGTYLGNPSTFFAIDAQTGGERWRQPGFSTFNILTISDRIFVNASNRLLALEKSSGNILWQIPFEGTGHANMAYLEGYLYHVRDYEIVVIENAAGEVVHREPPPDKTYFWHLAVSSDKVFAQTSRQLIAYEPWHLREEQ